MSVLANIGRLLRVAAVVDERPNEALSLKHEVRMVKAALLYADAVDLTSLSLASLEGATGVGERRALIAAAEVGEGVAGGLPSGIRGAWYRKHGWATVESRAAHADDDARILRQWADDVSSNALAASVAKSELLRAIDNGVLHLGPDWRDGANWAPLIELSITSIAAKRALNGPGIPLFDDMTWFMHRMSTLGRAKRARDRGEAMPTELTATAIAAANEGALAAHLVGHLEAFPVASVDVILDVRKRLSPELGRFRAAVADLAAEMTGLPSSKDSVREIDLAYRREIVPKVLELDESIDSMGARATLRRGAGGVVATMGVLAGAAATIHGLAVAAAIPVARGINEEVKARREIDQQVRTSPFLFLYRANKLLPDR